MRSAPEALAPAGPTAVVSSGVVDPTHLTRATGPRRGLVSVALGLGVFVLTLWILRQVRTAHPDASYSRRDHDRALSELAAAAGGPGRYFELADAAKTAVYLGTLEEAEEYARELLTTAEASRPCWNFGNAIHDGHVVLGLVALRRGDVDAAKRELLRAGDTPGSPQLNTFGPNMLLAKELLQRGEVSTVVEYFSRCRKFWERERGRLDRWTKDAREGRTPDFGANLVF